MMLWRLPVDRQSNTFILTWQVYFYYRPWSATHEETLACPSDDANAMSSLESRLPDIHFAAQILATKAGG
jgi:hypothetical protein